MIRAISVVGRTRSSISVLMDWTIVPQPPATPTGAARWDVAFASDHAADPIELLGYALVGIDDVVEDVGDLAGDAGQIGGQAHRPVALAERQQCAEQLAIESSVCGRVRTRHGSPPLACRGRQSPPPALKVGRRGIVGAPPCTAPAGAVRPRPDFLSLAAHATQTAFPSLHQSSGLESKRTDPAHIPVRLHQAHTRLAGAGRSYAREVISTYIPVKSLLPNPESDGLSRGEASTAKSLLPPVPHESCAC